MQKIHDVAKWIDVFCDAGEVIYGEEFDIVLALVGLAVTGLVPPMERLGDLGQLYADKYKEKQAEDTVDEFIKKLKIKKESDGETLPS